MGSTQENVKKNLAIKLQTNLPPKGKKIWAMKGAQMQKGNYSHEKMARKDDTYISSIEKELFYKGPRSHPSLSDDDFYNTPKMIFQEKVEQPHTLSLDDRHSNNIFQHSTNSFMSDYSLERLRRKHLETEIFNDEKTSSFEFTIPYPDENEILRMQLAEKEAFDRKFQKEREENIMKSYEEKQELLR